MVYSLFTGIAVSDKSGLVKYFKVSSLVCCVLLSYAARRNTDETLMQYRVCGNSLVKGSIWGSWGKLILPVLAWIIDTRGTNGGVFHEHNQKNLKLI